jgi:tungstate transport system ATP-binding protein
MIKIRDLLIQRNKRDVLNIGSLDIQRGETLTVVGPNGAGKSTLLLALANLLKPVRGDIQFDGKSVTQWNDLEYRRKISFVFQAPLLMDMTVEQNVALGLRFRGISKDESRQLAGRWIKAMGVESLSKRKRRQLWQNQHSGSLLM